jgi:hypothetical protein
MLAMRTFNTKILLSLTLSLLAFGGFGCAKKGARDTALQFTLSAYFESKGGAMLWGENLSTGESFAHTVSLDSGYNRNLTFGLWKFWVVAWASDQDLNQLTGLTQCDFKSANVNNGSTGLSVTFNLSNLKCKHNEFTPSYTSFDTTSSPPTTRHMFPQVLIKNCRDLTLSTAASVGCNNESEAGYFTSYKVLLAEHNGLIPTGTFLESRCVETENTATSGKSLHALPANIPLGGDVNKKAPMLTIVRGYYGSTDCDETDDENFANISSAAGPALGFRNEVFERGLFHGPKNSANPKAKIQSEAASNTCLLDYGEPNPLNCTAATKVCSGGDNDGRFAHNPASCPSGSSALTINSATSDETMYHLVLESNGADVCQGARASSTFASGRGDLGRPFTICNANQFNNIGDNLGLLTLDYEVLKNLDFNDSTNAFTVGCGSELLNNFIPIGGGYSPSCDIGTASSFSGSFNGNNFTFLAPRFMTAGNTFTGPMGLFRQTSQTLQTSQIKNIKINHGMVGGNSQVGLLVGNCEGPISNIKITNSEADGSGGYTGALAGQGNIDCTIERVSVDKTNVQGSGNVIGGIIGSTEGTITKTEFFGDVDAHDSDSSGANGSRRVGGIAGELLGSGTVSEVAVEGFIRSNGINLGGIVGLIGGSSAKLEDAYMKGAVYSNKIENTGSAVNVGGIVGNNSGTVARTLFIGYIEDNCTPLFTSSCQVGKITGTGTATNSFSQSDFGTLSKGGNDGTELSDQNLRVDTQYDASWVFTTPANNNGIWRHTTDDYPRLEMQKDHQCELAPNQNSVDVQAANRGTTATNPIIICKISQLKEIKDHLALNYKMADNISLWGWDTSNMPTNFSGSLDGAGFSLLGGELTGAMETNHNQNTSGFFASTTVNSSISNLNLLGLKNYAGTGNQAGGVAGVNNGIITNVLFVGEIDGDTNVGLITGKNTGDIIGSKAFGTIIGATNVGGIAGENASSATILKSITGTHITPNNLGATNIGGITGLNDGELDQVDSDAHIFTEGSSKIGGIAGTNNSIIKNSSFSGLIKLNSADPTNPTNPTNVGGIAGDNSSGTNITASVSFGQVEYIGENVDFMTNNTAQTWGPISGNVNTVGSDVYWSDDAFQIYNDGDPNFWEANVPTCTYSTTPSPGQMTITFDSAGMSSTAQLSPTNMYLIVNHGNSHQFKITDITDNQIITVDSDVNECSPLIVSASFLEVRQYKVTSSAEGTKLSLSEAADIETYCLGAVGTPDPDFKCAANDGFDIIYEYSGSDNFGTQRFLDQIFAEIYNLTPPAPPMWIMGERPRLFIEK